MKLMDRYLLQELLPPFGFALGILGALMSTGFVLFGLIEESARFHYSLALILKVLVLRLPEMLYFTLPMAMLLGSLLAASRLAADLEWLTFRLNGISFWRLVLPWFIFAVLLSGLTVLLNETLVPPASWLARQALHQARTGELQLANQQEHLFFRLTTPEGLQDLIYARYAGGQGLEQVVVQHFEGQDLRWVLQAKSASFDGDRWHFKQGQTLELNPEEDQILQARFSDYQYALPAALPEVLAESRQPQEMNLAQLGQHLVRLQALGQNVAALSVRWHQKIAIPFAAVVFAMLGAAIGTRSLGSRAQGLGLSLLIVFCFYLLMSTGTALADAQQIPAWLGAWFPHVLLLPVVLALMQRRNQQA